MATRKRDVFVNSIEMVPVGDRTNIPTAVWYSENGLSFGDEAYEQAVEPSEVCDNFKIQLGEQEPGLISPKQLRVANGKYQSVHAIANDYLKHLVDCSEQWVEGQGLTKASRVLVAEPVAIHEQGATRGDWLANYRNHIRRILGSRFEDVDFLPEPFAVFQYYRYGIKHPLVADKRKHVALVIDFGGGTFDVSVIETTNQGDVSNSGRNSKPLAASSIAIGGFSFNRIIAEYLLFKPYIGKSAPSGFRDALRKVDDLRRDPKLKIEDLRADYQNFFRHFGNLLFHVEKAKIGICSNITNWALDETPENPASYRLNIPASPLAKETGYFPLRLDQLELRDLFVERIWKKFLQPSIASALDRARGEIEGQKISLVLLSGGSANVRWLHHLIKNMGAKDLQDAEPLELQENFQEIVAKGLAVECARKTVSEGDGDFRAVTYNKLCLVLDPDNRGAEIPKFRPTTPGLPPSVTDGVLLPSASSLKNHIDGSIGWKFKLSHPPKHQMDYFFMSSSFDPEDHQNVHNIEDHAVITPPKVTFDSSLNVSIEVRRDGTAVPKFVYRNSGPAIPEISVVGRPFYLDMTFGGEAGVGDAYLGIDFGTSNSSISYVSQAAVTVYKERSTDLRWQNISDLTQSLPYPIASPLASYMAATGSSALDLKGIEAIESFLAFGAYVAYAEYRTLFGKDDTKLFKSFTQRSAGPLWALLRDGMAKLRGKGKFTRPLEGLFDKSIYEEVDRLVSDLSAVKHGKALTPPDYIRGVRLLGNIFADYCEKFQFGLFESVQKKRFSSSKFEGVFKCAVGAHVPFVKLLRYEGPHSFSEDEAVLVLQEEGLALPLNPLLFWSKPGDNFVQSESDLYLYDMARNDGEFSFCPIGAKGELRLTAPQFTPIVEGLNELRLKDSRLDILAGVELTPVEY